VTVEAYAKVNLTLEVLGERSDGYHALRSLVMPVSLADALEIEGTEDGVIVSDTGYADDLCVKAARALRDSIGGGCVGAQPSRGARIRVTKRIPVGGGLGGGSADAAATLVALNELWQCGLSREELAALGARVGSDVPALVLGGAVVMEGRGEKVTRLSRWGQSPSAFNLQLSTFNLVLVNPGVFCSTKEVFGCCRARSDEEPSATSAMIEALRIGDRAALVAALANDLQEPAVALHPEIAAAMKALEAAGAEGVMMSGSGSTVFGIVASEARACEIAAELESGGWWARAVRTLV